MIYFLLACAIAGSKEYSLYTIKNTFFSLALGAQYLNWSFAVLANRCVCLGDTLTYECTTMGVGSTVWTGSAFNNLWCTEILLLHNRILNGGTNGTCNNGATYIVARSLSVEGNNYTSQLSVTATPETAGKTIMCYSDNGSDVTLISHFVIPTIGLSCCVFHTRIHVASLNW